MPEDIGATKPGKRTQFLTFHNHWQEVQGLQGLRFQCTNRAETWTFGQVGGVTLHYITFLKC